jgi:UDP-glucose 4-epimerase
MPDIRDSRILVVGGAGFIGSHLVDQLVREPVSEIVVLDNFTRGSRANIADAERDERVRIVEGSMLDTELLATLMEGTDYVFHLAALWLWECVNRPREALDANIVGTFNVMEAARLAGVRKLVYSSSASVYGDALETPMTEDHPFNNRTMYGATKIASEQILRAYHEQHGLDYVGLRYMNVYGPRMDYSGAYVSVIMKVLDKIDAGEPPIIFGDGSQTYDFVHVGDVARANVLALKSDATDVNLNVGTGVATTIRELVDELLAVTGSDVEPVYNADEAMFVTHRVGSPDLARELIGLEYDVKLADGLRSVVEWRRADAAARLAPGASVGGG